MISVASYLSCRLTQAAAMDRAGRAIALLGLEARYS